MFFKFAIILTSMLAESAVFVGSTSTRLGGTAQSIKAGGDGATETLSLRKMKKIQVDDAITFHDNKTADKNESPSFRGLRKVNDWKDWNHGTIEFAAKRRDSIEICAPSASKDNDTLFLFLSSSGGHLPLQLDGWSRGAECFKAHNKQKDCFRASDCVQKDGPFCTRFRRGDMEGGGNDLGTVVFYKRVTDNPGCWDVDLRDGTTWAIVTAITNVNERDPIRDISSESCDKSWSSVFPSVRGKEDDVLLMSSSFDDPASVNMFTPPSGATTLGYIRVREDAGFLTVKSLIIQVRLERASQVDEEDHNVRIHCCQWL